MTGSELRRKYLEFFKARGHAEISGRSLIPENDPTVLFTTVTASIGAMQVFSIPYIMTKGGPEDASRMVVMWVQETGFKQFRMGYASSLAYIFFIVILILTLVELRYLRTKWSY